MRIPTLLVVFMFAASCPAWAQCALSHSGGTGRVQVERSAAASVGTTYGMAAGVKISPETGRRDAELKVQKDLIRAMLKKDAWTAERLKRDLKQLQKS